MKRYLRTHDGLRRLPPAVSIGSLRMLNTYESAGLFEGRCSRLDDLIIEHLYVVKELQKLDAWEECLCRMVAEGYNATDIAEEMGLSVYAVQHKARQIRSLLQEMR